MIPQGTTEKRFDTDFYVEGFATTFDKPYVMYEYGGIKYCEVIDRNALVGADLSDVNVKNVPSVHHRSGACE